MKLKKLVTVDSLFTAELIEKFLEEQGIQVVIKRPDMFDNPYLGSTGPRELYVNKLDFETAKKLLEESKIVENRDNLEE